MYEVILYEDKSGKSSVADYIAKLDVNARRNKDSSIRLKKIYQYFEFLQTYGSRAGLPISKHIEDGIWKLRPTNDRFFFVYWKDNTFVILHHYIKKSQKMPRKELDKAKRNLKDFLERS